MIQKVFTIYDSKVEAFLPPFFMPNKGAALRALTELVSDEKHQFGKYSADFTLFEMGSFDDSSAKFTLHKTPESVVILIELKRASEPPKVA